MGLVASPLASQGGFRAYLNSVASRTAGLRLLQVCVPHPSLLLSEAQEEY